MQTIDKNDEGVELSNPGVIGSPRTLNKCENRVGVHPVIYNYLPNQTMEQHVKLVKLIKLDHFNQFSAHLTHCATLLSPSKLSLLLFEIINSKVTEPSKYIDAVLKFDVDPNSVYSNTKQNPELVGKTVLMAACEGSKIQAVVSLLQCPKLKLGLIDAKGDNCMFYALRNDSEQDCYQMISAIVSHDQALANSTNLDGSSILIEALEKKSLRVVELLLKNSADPNYKCKRAGETALHKALLNTTNSCEKKKDIILLLLNYKADPSVENKQQKSCFDVAQEIDFEVDWLIDLIKEKEAEQSCSEYVACHEIMNSVTKEDENSVNQNFSIDVSSESDDSQFSIQKLTQEIDTLSKSSEKRHEQSWKDVEYIYHQLAKIGSSMHLKIDIIGSYATGLWTPYSDIDVVFTNQNSSYIQIEETLGKIFSVLKSRQRELGIKEIYFNKNNNGNSFPNIKMDLEQKLNYRKIDITIFQKKNNGQKYVRFIAERLYYNPFLKPVFFAVHKLLRSYDLANPAKNGLKTYAIFLMVLLSAERCKAMSSGELFINTIYFYAHYFLYEEQLDGTSKINIYDPLNQNNNVGGRKTDVNRLREMFKATDYGLRFATGRNILDYLFSLHNIFEM